MLFKRDRMDDRPHARHVVAATGGRGGFSGLSGRRRTDNDARVHHNIHSTITFAAVTAVTATAITAGNVTVVTAAAVTAGNVTAVTVTAIISSAVAAVTAATVTAGNVTVVTAAVPAVTIATVTAVSVAVLGDAAGGWPYPLVDDPIFRHADDAFLSNAGGTASPVASENQQGFQSQRWASVHRGQEGVSVDSE